MAHPKIKPLGYALLWQPPTETVAVSIDAQRLLIQLLAIGLLTALGYLLAGSIKNRDDKQR
jgi:hypothetical protein